MHNVPYALRLCFLPCVMASVSLAAEKDIDGSSGEAAGRRLVSNRLSEAIFSGIVYQPDTAFRVPPTDNFPAADGDVFLMPKYTVEDSRLPQLGEHNLFSKEELTKLAMRRYFSRFHRNVMSRYRIGHEDERYAMMKYEADERRQNIAKAALEVELYRLSDEKAAKRAKEEGYSTFLRRPGIGASRLPGRW